MRREFPTKVKRAAFERSGGFCEGTLPNGMRCPTKLFPGKYVYDHDTPDWMGGEPTLENCRVLCNVCDKVKTPRDRQRINKTRRVRDRHIGIRKRSRFPGSRDSDVKIKIGGGVVDRATGEPIR